MSACAAADPPRTVASCSSRPAASNNSWRSTCAYRTTVERSAWPRYSATRRVSPSSWRSQVAAEWRSVWAVTLVDPGARGGAADDVGEDRLLKASTGEPAEDRDGRLRLPSVAEVPQLSW